MIQKNLNGGIGKKLQNDITPSEAIKLQNELKSQIVIQEYRGEIKTVAGFDISLNRFSDTAYAGAIMLSYPDLKILDHVLVKSKVTFPYIPGLLSFREIPVCLEVWEKIKHKPDVVVMDGQGMAHPRRMGIATHFGMLIDKPTIGCAKSVLYGKFDEPDKKAGSVAYIKDPKNMQEIIGAALRTKEKVKPVIISPGYKISLDQSVMIMKESVRGYRIPEPTRLAHELVNSFRRGELAAT